MNEDDLTEEEFVEHWIDRMVGIAIRGLIHDSDERIKGPLTAGQYALKTPEKCRELLRLMYRHMRMRIKNVPKEPPKNPG